MINFYDLPTKILDSGQILVEIETNIWVDFETYKPKDKTLNEEVIENG